MRIQSFIVFMVEQNLQAFLIFPTYLCSLIIIHHDQRTDLTSSLQATYVCLYQRMMLKILQHNVRTIHERHQCSIFPCTRYSRYAKTFFKSFLPLLPISQFKTRHTNRKWVFWYETPSIPTYFIEKDTYIFKQSCNKSMENMVTCNYIFHKIVLPQLLLTQAIYCYDFQNRVVNNASIKHC